MKILVCYACNDFIALRSQKRTCVCGKSEGNYTLKGNRNDAEVSGPCIVMAVRQDQYMEMFGRIADIKSEQKARLQGHEHLLDVGIDMYLYDIEHPKSAVKRVDE